MIHPERLQTDIGDGPVGAHGDHGAEHVQRLLEWQAQRAVLGVHQRVAARLDLGDSGVAVHVVGAGSAGAHDLASDIGVGLPQQRHRLFDAACRSQPPTIIRCPSYPIRRALRSRARLDPASAPAASGATPHRGSRR
jgi:hypothetical protein